MSKRWPPPKHSPPSTVECAPGVDDRGAGQVHDRRVTPGRRVRDTLVDRTLNGNTKLPRELGVDVFQRQGGGSNRTASGTSFRPMCFV